MKGVKPVRVDSSAYKVSHRQNDIGTYFSYADACKVKEFLNQHANIREIPANRVKDFWIDAVLKKKIPPPVISRWCRPEFKQFGQPVFTRSVRKYNPATDGDVPRGVHFHYETKRWRTTFRFLISGLTYTEFEHAKQARIWLENNCADIYDKDLFRYKLNRAIEKGYLPMPNGFKGGNNE